MKYLRTLAALFGLLISILGCNKVMSTEFIVADIYNDLRNKVFNLDPATIGLVPTNSNRIWGMLMETGYPEAVATLVTIADGSVSLYFSNGGGLIGVGEYEETRKASDSFISSASEYIQHAKLTKKFPLPKIGYSRFYFLTFNGIFTFESKEDDLGNKRLSTSPLFFKAQEVITQARIADGISKENFRQLMHACTTGNLSMVKKLLEKGGNPNRSDSTGLTPLMAAAYTGKDEVIKILLKFGSSIDSRDSFDYTALMFASNAGHILSAQLLILEGAKINAKDKDGSTPLMFAAQNAHVELVRILLKNGADPKIAGSHGLSAIGFAKQNDHKEVENILRGNNKKVE